MNTLTHNNRITQAMRRILFGIVGAAALTLSTSCEKKLEEVPYSYYAVSSFFRDVNQATMAVLGIYSEIGQYDTYGRSMSVAYATDSDIGQIDGTNNLSGSRRAIGHYASSPTEPWFEGSWRLLYIAIDRANLVIQKIPQMDMYTDGTDTQKAALNRLLGEALFLRGLIYFDLVRLWGDVPFKTEPTQAGDNLRLPKTDREIIYDQIFEDMAAAIPLLPWASEKTVDERVSRGAAKGIFARIALFRGGYSLRADGTMKRPDNYLQYYQIAARETKEIMESGEHDLNPSYEEIFRNYCSFKLEPKESMFEIAFFNAIGDPGNNTVIGTWNSPLTHADNPHGRANSFFKTHPVFYNSFEPNDIRRDIAVANFEIGATNNIILLTGNRDNLWSPGKWRKTWQNTSPKNPNNTDINWVLLRYADVLLMRAEAENEINNGPTTAAYDAVDAVRNRANLSGLTRNMSKAAFFDHLVKERAHELCFEGWRKYDLIRWNMLGPKLRETRVLLRAHRNNFPFVSSDQFTDNKHELYPIPQREIDQNPALTQNPGY